MELCECGCGMGMKEFDSRNRNRRFIKCHNLKRLHLGKKYTNERKEKIRKIRSGKDYEAIYGIEKAKEVKEKIRLSKIGMNNHRYGRHPSKETLEKRRISMINLIKNNPERILNQRSKMIEKWKDNTYREKVIKNSRESLVNMSKERKAEIREKLIGGGFGKWMLEIWKDPLYKERLLSEKNIKDEWSYQKTNFL